MSIEISESQIKLVAWNPLGQVPNALVSNEGTEIQDSRHDPTFPKVKARATWSKPEAKIRS